MNEHNEENLPIIQLSHYTEPTHLYPMQEALIPYMDYFVVGYWLTFWGVLVYLSFKNIIKPLFQKFTKKT